ncbi:GAF domain-containing protein [Fulvivirga sedimenti]|uniref:GAF domain-containing protein n=1 Tax=Fulvivirga sedimenti TaxID=2879465 RepID=A0A9X1HLM3_9BACT|nr:GAF domain-containing protein [Fulvivirga sedimenti]MCA6073240.1 GAF domain-containing protein [Fulvivirga sedimenti]
MILSFFKRLFRSENMIQVGIALVVILILHNFVVALISRDALTERNDFIKQRQAILAQIDQIGTNVNLIDLGFRGYHMIPKENFKNPLEIAREQHNANMDSLQSQMKSLGYSNMDSIGMVDRWVKEYFALADRGVMFISEGQPEEAVDLFANDPGYDLWAKYFKVQTSMRLFLEQLENENYSRYQRITQYAFFAQLLLVCMGCMMLGIMVYRLSKSRKKIQNLFSRIKESNQQYVFNDGSNSDVNENNETVISRLIDNLRHAAEFIQSITSGNLDVEWKGMSRENRNLNTETIAGELISMRDQMVKVKENEGNRIWVSEGISTFSEVIRKNQDDLVEMSDRLLASLVKYLKANQGALFFLNEDEGEAMLELVSCFAYDKKKFVEKKVPVDVGLLGQAFLEGETILLKEIPQNYINITSGLGEAVPNTLIMIPLIFNEETVGVLEIASLKPFTKIHLELLEKISEIVASAVITSQNAVKMQRLLQTANQNTEEMQAQEEEMRQNMEELQATQEELARKEAELQKRIDELEAEQKPKSAKSRSKIETGS